MGFAAKSDYQKSHDNSCLNERQGRRESHERLHSTIMPHHASFENRIRQTPDYDDDKQRLDQRKAVAEFLYSHFETW